MNKFYVYPLVALFVFLLSGSAMAHPDSPHEVFSFDKHLLIDHGLLIGLIAAVIVSVIAFGRVGFPTKK